MADTKARSSSLQTNAQHVPSAGLAWANHASQWLALYVDLVTVHATVGNNPNEVAQLAQSGQSPIECIPACLQGPRYWLLSHYESVFLVMLPCDL